MADIRAPLRHSGLRLNQLQDRMHAAATSADTDEHGRVCVGGLVLMCCCSSHNRSTSGLLIRANCMRRMHHVQGEADDVTGLLIAALAASIHANRPWHAAQTWVAPSTPAAC